MTEHACDFPQSLDGLSMPEITRLKDDHPAFFWQRVQDGLRAEDERFSRTGAAVPVAWQWLRLCRDTDTNAERKQTVAEFCQRYERQGGNVPLDECRAVCRLVGEWCSEGLRSVVCTSYPAPLQGKEDRVRKNFTWHHAYAWYLAERERVRRAGAKDDEAVAVDDVDSWPWLDFAVLPSPGEGAAERARKVSAFRSKAKASGIVTAAEHREILHLLITWCADFLDGEEGECRVNAKGVCRVNEKGEKNPLPLPWEGASCIPQSAAEYNGIRQRLCNISGFFGDILPPEVPEEQEAATPKVPTTAARPDDLCSTAVAVAEFNVTRSTIRLRIKNGTLRDYRSPTRAKNAALLLSRAELNRFFTRR